MLKDLTNNFVVGRYIKKLDKLIEAIGFQPAMYKLTTQTGAKLITEGINKELENILKHKPVIIVANHPHEAEIIALLASLPKREDVYIVADANLLNICPNLDKHLIPVFVKHHPQGSSIKRYTTKFLNYLHHSPTFSEEEEHKRNILSIKNAGEKVKLGGLVIIFPAPNVKDQSKIKWRDGIGYMVKDIGQLKDAYLIQVYIKGTSSLDFLRLIPNISKLMPIINLCYSKPLPLSEVIEDNPKEIRSKLEKNYYQWLRSIS